ncbi:MAG: alpha/beta hydrolase [Deltaproteobacteria bacterium]|nr:MAG: alpha/beta hydrolase [Deltaproteobacteria bacterium]
MEEKCIFQSENYRLEGLIDKGDGDQAIIITHPHSLYGGNMKNYVVESICRVYREKGYTTLRFNFRGVGNSKGNFENGLGEQKDVLAAYAYLLNSGLEKIDLAGYSFGAWVNAMTVREDLTVNRMVMVSPPVGFMDFGPITLISCLKLVITGSRDEIAPANMITEMLPTWNPEARLEVINGADHFYDGFIKAWESILSVYA